MPPNFDNKKSMWVASIWVDGSGMWEQPFQIHLRNMSHCLVKELSGDYWVFFKPHWEKLLCWGLVSHSSLKPVSSALTCRPKFPPPNFTSGLQQSKSFASGNSICHNVPVNTKDNFWNKIHVAFSLVNLGEVRAVSACSFLVVWCCFWWRRAVLCCTLPLRAGPSALFLLKEM